MEMNDKGMVAEAIGSMAITLLVWGTITENSAPHDSAVMAGAAGVTLAIMWMTFKGSEILPISQSVTWQPDERIGKLVH